MKKIIFISIITLLVVSCSDTWNERNLPTASTNSRPVKVIDQTIPCNYAAVVKLLQDEAKGNEDSIALVTLADIINKAQAFPSKDEAIEPIKKYLTSETNTNAATALYKSIDANSQVSVTFDVIESTRTVNITNVDTLQTADYDAMGTASGQPGRYDNFDASMDLNFYLPLFLKNNFPYSKENDRRAVCYKFYTGSATETRVNYYKYNDGAWASTTNGATEYSYTAQEEIFKLNDNRAWEHVNTLIYYETFTNGNQGAFTAYDVLGDARWDFSNPNYGARISEFSSGTNHESDHWLVSPTIDFTNRGEIITLSLDYAVRYLMNREQIQVWVSKTYTDGTPNEADWTKLAWNAVDDATWNFKTRRFNLNDFANETNVHIAIRYTSSATTSSTFEVKNIFVEAVEYPASDYTDPS